MSQLNTTALSQSFICALSDPNTSLAAYNIQCFEARDAVPQGRVLIVLYFN